MKTKSVFGFISLVSGLVIYMLGDTPIAGLGVTITMMIAFRWLLEKEKNTHISGIKMFILTILSVAVIAILTLFVNQFYQPDINMSMWQLIMSEIIWGVIIGALTAVIVMTIIFLHTGWQKRNELKEEEQDYRGTRK